MPDSPEFTILKAARLIDGNGGPVAEQAAVLLHRDSISQIGTHETVQAPEGASVREVDYGDATIMPGLVDSHVHLIGIGDGRAGDELVTLPDEVLTVQAAQNVRRHLYSGVTTVRDCGAKNRTTFLLRDAVEMGIVPSPRLVLSGRPVAIIGGHLSYFGIQATGPGRVSRSSPTARQRRRRLHQDHRDRRKHPYQLFASAVVQRGRAFGDLRGGP